MFRARQPSAAAEGSRYEVEWAVTDRHPPTGSGADTFTLGGRDPAKAALIAANRQRLAQEMGLSRDRLRFMSQVHGSQVTLVSGPGPSGQQNPTCDAMVTQDTGIALAVLVADCTPVLLWDAEAGWVGAVHAGRAGMMATVVSRCVQQLRERGAGNLQALVGPSICSRCYEVSPDLQTQAASVHPAAAAMSWTGTPAIDVAAGVVAQLVEHDVEVQWLPGCTRESPDLFSHRGEPDAGRFAAVVRLRERSRAVA